MKKPTLTEKGKLLSEPFGKRPYTVTLREERAGESVLLDYREGGKRVKESLRFPVRSQRGKGWLWDDAALARARDAAEAAYDRIKVRQLRQDVRPVDLTVEGGFALYHDRGGLPKSRSARALHKRARAYWTNLFGPETAWARIERTDVTTGCERLADQGKLPTALAYVAALRATHHWLAERNNLEGLRDPTLGFNWRAWRAKLEQQVRRPRYSPTEAVAIVAVRHAVDPRFALLIALMDDSGARREAIRTTMRSALDRPLDIPPAEGRAPHGWVEYPPLKRQRPVLHYLTAFERREIDAALTTYLRELEDIYRETGRDYPLLPGADLGKMTVKVVRPSQPKAYVPVSASLTERWLRDAERRAGVPHVTHRAFHGLRRGWSDLVMQEADLKTLTVAGGWSNQATPERIYLERHRDADRERAREVMEKKRAVES